MISTQLFFISLFRSTVALCPLTAYMDGRYYADGLYRTDVLYVLYVLYFIILLYYIIYIFIYTM